MKHRLRIALLILSSLLLLAMIGTSWALNHMHDTVERFASHALGRKVTIGILEVSYHPLHLKMENVDVANAPWGKAPAMLHIDSITAEPQISSLFTGRPRFNHLSIDGAVLALERNENGTGNWKADPNDTHSSSPQEAREKRTGFPTIFDLAITKSTITMLLSSGHTLKVDFHTLTARTQDATQHVALKVDGAYNDIPVQLAITTGSYDQLHDIGQPFDIALLAEGGTAKIDAKLQSMAPLDLDQFTGTMHAEIGKLGEAAKFFGASFDWDVPMALTSPFSREGDEWKLSELQGHLAGNPFKESHITFLEGKRREPDNIDTAMHFERLKAASFMRTRKNTSGSMKDISIDVSEHTAIRLHALITAQEAQYAKVHVSELSLKMHMAEGVRAFEQVSMTILGTRLSAFLTAKEEDKTTRITAKAELPAANITELLQLFDVTDGALQGHLKALLTFNARGHTLAEWQRSGKGRLTLAVDNGKISRQLVRLASIDVRSLFTADHTEIPMPCLRAGFIFDEGTGKLSPFAVRTAEGTLLGAGTINLPQQHFNLIFGTASHTTSKLALDVPVGVTGSFDDPHVGPARGKMEELTADGCSP